MSEASTYPGTLDTFEEQEAKKDKASKAFVNKLANAIIATQTALGIDIEGSMTDLKSRLAIMMNTNGAIAQGASFPVSPSPVEGQLFYRTDEDIPYYYNGTAWTAIGQSDIKIFTTTGSPHTFTIPAGVTKIGTIGAGGGASGGDDKGGGGGGADTVNGYILETTPATDLTITIGAGGAAVGSGDGNDGNDTTITGTGVSLTLNGGNKGLSSGTGGAVSSTRTLTGGNTSSSTGGDGGSPIKPGGAGGTTTDLGGGGGGGSELSPGGDGGNNAQNGEDGGIGAGGGGGGNSSSSSGAGGDGIVILMFNVPE